MPSEETATGGPSRRFNSTLWTVVLTAKDLTAEDRQRLNGHVERIFQKGARSREELLRELRTLVRNVRARG